jgi:hypothetical protein
MYWIGYILSALIGMSVFASMSHVQVQNQQTNISSAQFRIVKKDAMALAAMIERDFKNVASNFPNFALSPDTAIVALDTTSSTRVFEFWGQTVQGQAPELIRYEWNVVDHIDLKQGNTPLYQIRRMVDGNLEGMSVGYVTQFDIDLRRGNGSAITNFSDTRQVAVFVKSVSGIGTNRLVEETRWNSVYHPLGMTRTVS